MELTEQQKEDVRATIMLKGAAAVKGKMCQKHAEDISLCPISLEAWNWGNSKNDCGFELQVTCKKGCNLFSIIEYVNGELRWPTPWSDRRVIFGGWTSLVASLKERSSFPLVIEKIVSTKKRDIDLQQMRKKFQKQQQENDEVERTKTLIKEITSSKKKTRPESQRPLQPSRLGMSSQERWEQLESMNSSELWYLAANVYKLIPEASTMSIVDLQIIREKILKYEIDNAIIKEDDFSIRNIKDIKKILTGDSVEELKLKLINMTIGVLESLARERKISVKFDMKARGTDQQYREYLVSEILWYEFPRGNLSSPIFDATSSIDTRKPSMENFSVGKKVDDDAFVKRLTGKVKRRIE